MKNADYFPFERNRYFYGKLLSVEDFELEQNYVIDKRRMANRFLQGTGVVAGLHTFIVDEQNISVERGIAFDSAGREIVLDKPISRKLSLFDGFDAYNENPEAQGYMYLCIEYSEENMEPVHNIAGSSAYDARSGEFNKILEGCHLYLTQNEPKSSNLSISSIYEKTQTIFWGNGIRIKHTMPKYAMPGSSAELRVEIENMGQQQSFAFSYDVALTCFTYEGKSQLKVTFNEAFFKKSGKYQLTYKLDTKEVSDVNGIVSIVEDTFLLSLEQQQAEAKAAGKNTVQIVNTDVKEKIITEYYNKNMDRIQMDKYQQGIYLAKIFLIKAGESYVIDSLEPMPFRQYVYNNVLGGALMELLSKPAFGGASLGQQSDRGVTPENRSKDFQMAQGVVRIPLKEKQKGKRNFSKEILHGLGIGQVTIILGNEQEKEQELFGSTEVFEQEPAKFETAARVDKIKGSFTVGIRLIEDSQQEYVDMHWTALKNNEELLQEKNDRRIFINPNVLDLKTRESYYLEAICSNMNDKGIKWSVKDNGGQIDENGMYTAPNRSGVYEVIAQSIAYPEIRASMFIVVRDDYGE